MRERKRDIEKENRTEKIRERERETEKEGNKPIHTRTNAISHKQKYTRVCIYVSV